jgi:hypothetical protein
MTVVWNGEMTFVEAPKEVARATMQDKMMTKVWSWAGLILPNG